MNAIDGLRRIEQVKPRLMVQQKALEQLLVQAVGVAGQFVEAVLAPASSEIE